MFIAREVSRPLGTLPDRVAISVVTLGELELGVLAATDDEIRARRADTLALARQADPIPVSEAVMTAWARLVDDCRRAGVHRTVKPTDALSRRLPSSTDYRWSARTRTSSGSPALMPRCASSGSDVRVMPAHQQG